MSPGQLPYGANWFDIVWVVALLYGIYSGVRTGPLRETGRLLSWGLITWVSLTFYARTGDWIKTSAGIDAEPARLTAYLLLVISMYMLSLIIRRIINKLTRKTNDSGFLQNIAGALEGTVRMALVMTFVTVWLSLTRSPFLHRHISHESKFSSQVVDRLPAVAGVANKPFKEEFLFFRDVQRLADPNTNVDDIEMIEFRTNKPAKPK